MRTKLDSSTPHLGGDGGGLLWIAFVLAMILMFLASCKSKQVTINEQVDSVSVRKFSLADIRRQVLDFCFDSMEIVVGDSCREVEGNVKGNVEGKVEGKVEGYKLKIKGGRMRAESLEHRAESVEKKDSVKVKSEYHEEKIVKARGSWMLSWVWILVILFIVVFIINTHIRH